MGETLEYIISISIVALLIIDFVTIIILILVVNRQALRLTVTEYELHNHERRLIDIEGDISRLRK